MGRCDGCRGVRQAINGRDRQDGRHRTEESGKGGLGEYGRVRVVRGPRHAC